MHRFLVTLTAAALIAVMALSACEAPDEFEPEGGTLDNPVGVAYRDGILFVSNANTDQSHSGNGFILSIDARLAVDDDTREDAILDRRDTDPYLADLIVDLNEPLVYVANRYESEILVFDASDPADLFEVDMRDDKEGVQGLPCGREPYDMVMRPDGRYLYTTNIRSGDVSVIDLEANRLAKGIILASGLVGIAIQPGSQYAYVTNRRFNSVSVIDTERNEFSVSFEPLEEGAALFTDTRGVAFSPDGTRAYVAVQSPPMVAIVDTAKILEDPDDAVRNFVPMHSSPYGIVMSPDGSECWVANFESKRILIIDTEHEVLVDRVDMGSGPTDMAVVQFEEDDPEQFYVFATAFESHSLAVIDGVTKENLGAVR